MSAEGQGTNPSINDLPRDLLAVVLSFLPIEYCLLTTDLVCKAFHSASKHPLCLDEQWMFYSFGINASRVARADKAAQFFTRYRWIPRFVVGWLPVLRSLTCVADLRELEILQLVRSKEDTSSMLTCLSAFHQLETLCIMLHCDSFAFPLMPHLKRLKVHFTSAVSSVVNTDTAHMPLLSHLHLSFYPPSRHREQLPHVSFPHSLKGLVLEVDEFATQALSGQELDGIAELPRLEILDTNTDDMFKLSHFCFSSTLTTLRLHRLSNEVKERLHLLPTQFPSLTYLLVAPIDHTQSLTHGDLAPFLQANSSSFKHLHLSGIPQSSLPYIALPSLTFLHLGLDKDTSLSPLSACVNLITLHTYIYITEQDAQVISGLTKLEQLHICVSCDACLTHICRLPRLKALYFWPAERIGEVAIRALAGLAPTIEELYVPHVKKKSNLKGAVLAMVVQCKRLNKLYTGCRFTDEQVLMIKSSLFGLGQYGLQTGCTLDFSLRMTGCPRKQLVARRKC